MTLIICGNCHIPFILLAISSPLAQLHAHKTQTLECSHSEHYSRPLDLCYVLSFISPFLQWPPKPLQCLTLMWCVKCTTNTRGNFTSLWWGQTKYKPLATNPSLGHVIWPSGCGDMAIPNQYYHCNSFAPFTSTSGISFKLHDIWLYLVIQTKIHMQILCLSLK